MDIYGYLDLISSENSRQIWNKTTQQYEDSNYMKLLEAVLTPVMDLQETVQNTSAFSASEAVGDQLDILGELIGVSRELPYVRENGTSSMTDDEYSVMVQMKIAQESWNGENSDAASVYANVLENTMNVSYRDNVDGSVTIQVGEVSQELAQMMYANNVYLVPANRKDRKCHDGRCEHQFVCTV